MVHFLHPLYFLILIPIIIFLILLYFYWWKKMLFWPILDLQSIFKSNSVYYKLYYLLIFLIFLVYITIFSKPVISWIIEKSSKTWIDIQIVLDISYSMLAEDLSPNRLQVAKDVISDFLDKIVSDRVWIIVFAWKTFTSMPLNFDYNIIKNILDKISVNTINQSYWVMQWTAVWDALILASDSFWKDNNREKIIILLTDWEANKGLDPIVSLKYIYENYPKVKVYTIWIWWLEQTSVKIYDAFWSYQELPVWWLDEETLKTIASNTNWKYFRATDKQTLENIFEEIWKLEKREIMSETLVINREKYSYYVYVLIFLFFWFILLKKIKKIF